MKIRMLSAALLAGLAVTQVASAQDYDDRWYLTGSVGYNLQDEDRRTDDAFAAALGVGRFISPEWSVEGALNYQNPQFKHNSDLLWSQYGDQLRPSEMKWRRRSTDTPYWRHSRSLLCSKFGFW